MCLRTCLALLSDIQDWVDTEGNPLTSTLGQRAWTGVKQLFQSGITPNAASGLGYLLPTVSDLSNLGTFGDSIGDPTEATVGPDPTGAGVSGKFGTVGSTSGTGK